MNTNTKERGPSVIPMERFWRQEDDSRNLMLRMLSTRTTLTRKYFIRSDHSIPSSFSLFSYIHWSIILYFYSFSFYIHLAWLPSPLHISWLQHFHDHPSSKLAFSVKLGSIKIIFSFSYPFSYSSFTISPDTTMYNEYMKMSTFLLEERLCNTLKRKNQFTLELCNSLWAKS